MQDENNKTWERKTLEKVALAQTHEQRRARHWGLFSRICVMVTFFILAVAYIPLVSVVVPKVIETFEVSVTTKEHVGIVQVNGVIAPETDASAGYIVKGLRDALENENTKAVILRINSPGGSPVQSDLVYKEILRQRKLNPDKPIYAVIEDIGASGAYYIAAAAENIYASKSSIVGSIGVTSGGSFGFVDAIKKLGVERRIYTSGENKAFLDPFLPEKPADKTRYEDMLKNVHQQFIDAVEAERKSRLAPDADLFNGYVWTGEESKKLGLIDGYGSVGSIARDVIGVEELVDYTPRPDFFTQFARQIGVSAAETMMETLMPAPSFK